MNRSVLLAFWLCGTALAQQVTTPEAHLGRPVGVDFQLADWSEVSGYFEKLARESPHVQTVRVGTTTEGRALLLSVISVPATSPPSTRSEPTRTSSPTRPIAAMPGSPRRFERER